MYIGCCCLTGVLWCLLICVRVLFCLLFDLGFSFVVGVYVLATFVGVCSWVLIVWLSRLILILMFVRGCAYLFCHSIVGGCLLLCM